MNSPNIPTAQDLQSLYNELNKLDRIIDSKESELNSLISEKSRSSQFVRSMQKPKRYSVEINIEADSLVPVNELFTVDSGTIFRPMYMDWSLRTQFFVSGTNPEDLLAITLPFGDPSTITRNALFSFLLNIKDTGSNREWSNSPIPDMFLCGGIMAPFNIGAGERGVLSGGTQVVFEVIPVLNNASASVAIGAGAIVSQVAQISMVGHEEFV